MKKLVLILSIVFLLIACGEIENNKYKIIYHDNGSTSGFPPDDKNQYESGSLATVLGKNTLEKTGYDFGGWNTKPDYSGDYYNVGDKIKIKNINIFLHAVWNEVNLYP